MIYAIIAAAIVIADFAVKYLIRANVGLNEVFFSIPHLFDFTYVQNRGAAFSMLSGRVPVLSVISIAFCVGVIIWWAMKKPTHPLLKTAFSMMFAGALGNAIDRVAYGYVVDFIAARFIDFPVFNIADMAITIGAGLFIVYIIFFDEDKKNERNKGDSGGAGQN